MPLLPFSQPIIFSFVELPSISTIVISSSTSLAASTPQLFLTKLFLPITTLFFELQFFVLRLFWLLPLFSSVIILSFFYPQ